MNVYWNSVFAQVPQRVVDLLLITTGMYKLDRPGETEIKPGDPDSICIYLETNYCSRIPNSEALDALEDEEAIQRMQNIHYINDIDTSH